MEKKNTHLPQLRPHLWRRINGSYYMGPDERSLRSLFTKDEAEAIVRYDEQFGKRAPKSKTKPRCSAAFEEFAVASHVRSQLTVDRHLSEWREWGEPVIGDMRVADVEPSDIIRVLTRARTTPSRKTGKIRTDIYNLESTLKVFFRWAGEEPQNYRAVNDNPVMGIGKDAKVSNPTGRKMRPDRVFRAHEFDLMAKHMDPNPGKYGHSRYGTKEINILKHQTIALVGGEIGARISELLALHLYDRSVDSGYEIIAIERQLRRKAQGFDPIDPRTWFAATKGEKGKIGDKFRVVPLSRHAVEVLDRYTERGLADGWLVERGLLFPNNLGRPLVPGHVGQWLSDSAERAGLRKFTSHDFRHTYVSTALEKGKSIERIAMATGHTPDMIRRVYGDVADLSGYYAEMADVGRPGSEDGGTVIEFPVRREASRHHDRVAR